MTVRRHHLTVPVITSGDWNDAELQAAKIIRRYTHEPERGKNAVSKDRVLRDAEFYLAWEPDDETWNGTVEVTV